MTDATAPLARYLRHEQAAVLVVGTRLVLLAAVVSNVDKAAWALTQLSEPAGRWSAWLLAAALEGALAIAAYALADAVKRGQRTGGLWGITALFAVMSAGANVAYFVQHLAAPATMLHTILAVAFGIAAPSIALATGVLAGVTTGQRLAEDDGRAAMAHEERMAELATEQARQKRLDTLAAVRLAKAEASGHAPVAPDKAPVVQAMSGDVSEDDRLILAAYADNPAASIRKVSGVLPFGRSKVSDRLKALEASGHVRRGPDGVAVIRSGNGHKGE